VYLSPCWDDSWSIKPWHENPDVFKYDAADLAGWVFQSMFRLSTATVASPTLNLSPYSEESWSIKPWRENPDTFKYEFAERTAFR
jgi:hypothetical protein